MLTHVEAAVCELRREHPRWGPVRIVHEIGRLGVVPVPSRMGVDRALVRKGLIEPGRRRRRREDWRRWERDAPMALWQMDIVGGVVLADGSECKIVTGLDDHSRFCVIAQVVVRAIGRAVCMAFARALERFEVSEEMLTDNGKRFTGRLVMTAKCCSLGFAAATASSTASAELAPDHHLWPTLNSISWMAPLDVHRHGRAVVIFILI